MQADAVRTYVEQVLPDMVTKHAAGSTRVARASKKAAAGTVNSQMAADLKKRMDEVFGQGGAKLKSMDLS